MSIPDLVLCVYVCMCVPDLVLCFSSLQVQLTMLGRMLCKTINVRMIM